MEEKINLKIVIDLPPVTKKNHGQLVRRGNRSYMLPSKPYQLYQKQCYFYLLKHQPAHPINKPLNLKCLFYMNHKRKCDLTNLLQAVQDILVDYGIIEDDNYNIVAHTDGSRVYYDKEHPRTEIYITEAED